MKFLYGDIVTIKSGFFAGLTGKCIDVCEVTERWKSGKMEAIPRQIHYTISINDVKTEPYADENNLELVSYIVDSVKEQKMVDEA